VTRRLERHLDGRRPGLNWRRRRCCRRPGMPTMWVLTRWSQPSRRPP